MGCERWSDAISALADGEDPGVDPAALQAHLDGCPGCRDHRDRVHRLARVAVLRPAEPTPDLAARVTAAVAGADRARGPLWARVLLAVVAVEVIVLSFPPLLWGAEGADAMGSSGAVPAHAVRHLGAFTVAYGVALLVVVARPARARTVLPVAGVLAAALAITASVDVVQGRIPLVGEALHLPELLSVPLVWLLASHGRGGRSGRPPQPGRPGWPGRADQPDQAAEGLRRVR